MDAYDLGYMEGRQDGIDETEELFEDHYNAGWQNGFDTAAEQYGKEKDDLARRLAVKEQECDLLRKRLAGLERELPGIWNAAYDQAIEDVMEKECAEQEE